MSHAAVPPRPWGMKPRRTRIALLLGLSQIAQGAVMIAAPALFYRAVPGVDETGPLNPHLMRDTGCAFLLAGVGLTWFARRPAAVPAGIMGAAYLCLHALMHVWDGVAGRERLVHLAHDIPMLGAIAALAVWSVWPHRGQSLTQER
jgi:hypothetical protein